MLLLMAMLAQDIVGPPGDDPPPAREVARRQGCAPGNDEILVCGTVDSQRLAPLPAPGDPRLFGPATVRLSPNKTLTARSE
jgi:hypothetical protein